MKKRSRLIIPILLVVFLGSYYWFKSWQDKFTAPRQEGPTLEFRVTSSNTLMAVTGNLAYFGVVKDEGALLYALKHSKDNKPGNKGAIKVGNNDIDVDTSYTITQTMDAWEIARILLNEGVPIVARGHGPKPTSGFTPELLPGGDIAPTLEEQIRAKYAWVETFEDCVKSISQGGGQVTSEEASKRTGHPRVCNTGDGRYFEEGQEGWSDYPPYP